MDHQASVYSSSELMVAATLATAIQVGFFVLLVVAGKGDAQVKAEEEPRPKEIPIAVKPVIDELPLLKLGSKKVKAKLPEMWKKQAPVKRYEATSAPSAKAEKTPQALPSTPLVKPDQEAPPPDAEVAKKVDEFIDAPESEPTNLPEEGSPDGVKEGTETDPLKARAVSQYKMRILAWFDARFRPPEDIPCEERKNLRSSVAAVVGGERQVTGYTVSSVSGNAVFDAKVRATMDAIVGQQLPPPPPLYPDILDSTVFPTFSGKKGCN
jgi:hypothetical protein